MSPQIRFAEFLFNQDRRQLFKDDRAVPLSPKAFELLGILLEERPRVVAKSELIERLWPDVVVEEANVRNLVAEIRQATGKTDPPLIRTAHRIGYAFTAPAIDLSTPRPMARLESRLRSHVLADGVNIIGRDESCAVFIDETGVSRHHAQIRISPGRAVLEDLGSKNGTWLNGNRVRSAELHHGDTIRIGLATVTYRVNAPGESTATVDAS